MPTVQHPDPGSTPTADAAERWLRQVTPLLDALARHLFPDLSGREVGMEGHATLMGDAHAHTSLTPERRDARFSALTACPGGFTRRDATRPCHHTHVELLIAAEGDTGSGWPRYAVRVVNVDLPRRRHRDAFIEPAPTWAERGEAVAEGLRLARERWGEVAVVHSTPSPDRTDTATDRGWA